MEEAKKRDYKAEYKKFQSSTKSKKYRAELNKYNRQKGTYGNGDGKDASHKGGKIVGFESQSKNRGRAEKSRLKKENKIVESLWNYIKEGDELQRWKVYIKGEKEPLILTGKDKNSVKKFAHKMIHNNKVKIARVVKEEILKEGLIKEFNKKHFLKLFADEAKSLIGQKKYVQKALKSKDLENWERKEYEGVYEEILERQKELKIRINNVSQMNEAGYISGAIDMSNMNDTYTAPKRDTSKGPQQFLQKFSSNEARAIVDGSMKNWVKDLRKTQSRVISDWMKAAKGGQIDFFDLIRGIKTGDFSRAHPYETEFLASVLTRDKIIDRFRKYFNGKKGKSGRTK